MCKDWGSNPEFPTSPHIMCVNLAIRLPNKKKFIKTKCTLRSELPKKSWVMKEARDSDVVLNKSSNPIWDRCLYLMLYNTSNKIILGRRRYERERERERERCAQVK